VSHASTIEEFHQVIIMTIKTISKDKHNTEMASPPFLDRKLIRVPKKTVDGPSRMQPCRHPEKSQVTSFLSKMSSPPALLLTFMSL
jgi:hypothetical protein